MQIEKRKYLINVGHVVLVNGKWDEGISSFIVSDIIHPEFKAKDKNNMEQLDLRFALEED